MEKVSRNALNRMSALVKIDPGKTILQSAVHDPGLRPGFNELRSHLIWIDECPNGIGLDALDVLAELHVARAVLFHGIDLPVDKESLRKIWDQATTEIPEWPGFKRLVLTSDDACYLKEMLDPDREI